MTLEHHEFLEFINEYAAEELKKAKGQEVSGSKLLPAQTDGPQTFFVNPYDFTSQYGLWRERRSALTWDTLRVMAEKNPIVSAIINTRIRQISSFSAPVSEQETTGNDQLGFKIAHKDSNKKLTSGEEKYVLELENFITHCGYVQPGQHRVGRDGFDIWLKKIVRDSLTFDAAVSELVPTRKGGIHSFYAVDAATIRLALTQQDDDGLDDKKYVQVLNGQIVVDYEPDEIMYGIRNPTTNIKNNGYGIAELEQLVTIVTNIFNAMTHNAMFFKNGAAVKGLINIKTGKGQTGAPNDQLEAFKRAWRAMVTGSQNAWSTPILQSEGVEFVSMGNTNREMEFQQYLEFLVKLACAVYSIDPAEINFYMAASSGGGSPMFESNQEAKLKMSKDKGLRPLLASIARWVNYYVLEPITPDFRFVWVGMDSKDEKEIVELRTKEVGSYMTVDEARAEAGKEPLGEEKGGNIILNPQYIQYLQQQAMAAQMGGMGGGGDEETGEGGNTDFSDRGGGDQDLELVGGKPEGEAEEVAGEKQSGEIAAQSKAKGSADEKEMKKSLLRTREKYLRIMIGG